MLYWAKNAYFELTEDALRFCSHRDAVVTSIDLKDITDLTYKRGLFADKEWQVTTSNGQKIGFNQNVDRASELAEAIEQRTGLKF